MANKSFSVNPPKRPGDLVESADMVLGQEEAQEPTLRRTIELPKSYFWKIKTEASKRELKDKDIWKECAEEYLKKRGLL